MNNQKITILGGGVIGITNAIVFAENGFEVEVISEAFLWEQGNDATFASLYPAASVVPHTVEGDTQHIFDASKAVFEQIGQAHPQLVRKQLHFEINENFQLHGDYLHQMEDWQVVENETYKGFPIPKRDENVLVFSHAFQMLFVEMDAYKEYLKQRVEDLKIKITKRKLSKNFFETAPNGIYINALSFFGNALMNDKSPMIAKAGILLRVKNQRLLTNSHFNQTIAYNYTWDDLEVYAYSRNGSMILGGTRYILENTKPVDAQIQQHIPKPFLEFNKGVPYPSYLIDVNKILLKQIYDFDLKIDSDDDFEVLIGLRPVRKAGINMEIIKKEGLIVLNSYGFGGAGVTLSWGCALENLNRVWVLM